MITPYILYLQGNTQTSLAKYKAFTEMDIYPYSNKLRNNLLQVWNSLRQKCKCVKKLTTHESSDDLFIKIWPSTEDIVIITILSVKMVAFHYHGYIITN